MSILIGRDTRVIVQGATGRFGTSYTRAMIDCGTTVVAGVTPGKGGIEHAGLPIYDTVAEAVECHAANASVIVVPPAACKDAMLEAIEAELGFVACITDGVPVHDSMEVVAHLRGRSTVLIGPNCPGAITPAQANLGIMPPNCFMPGPVGIVSRSGTLTYQTAATLCARGIGQSTALGIGGDPVVGSPFIEILERFEADPETKLVVLVGEIGGTQEERAAEFIRTEMRTPVVAYIAGRAAPPGIAMGHAGAIVLGNEGTYESKRDALEAAGVRVARLITDVADLVAQALRSDD
jgi:succinyl-CoA synthetase alpha subunit